jgi:DNA anti-recombination protein RmuC
MTTLTLSIDEQSARTAQRIAQQRQTTVDAIVQELLDQLGREDSDVRHRSVEELERSFHEVSRPLGGKPWKQRDELYDR